MTLSKSEVEAQYPKMPSIPSDIEISQNASMKQSYILENLAILAQLAMHLCAKNFQY